mgnify:CR=1 FL=1
MRSKGQVAETVGAVVLAVMLVVGGYGSYKMISDNRFVGNEATGTVYDLKYCDVNIPKDKVVSFDSLEEAYEEGYEDAECNK